ncbi:MAG: putative inorganic carbon transporter subunit DabA, partial [Bacteroidia bacterium]
VMGLFGVANGADGDLRPGLPSQMIEVHDPIRLLIIVEHFPEIVLNTIKSVDAMYEWFINDWVKLVALNPETKELYVFKEGAFNLYKPLQQNVETVADVTPLLEKTIDNLPVYIIK